MFYLLKVICIGLCGMKYCWNKIGLYKTSNWGFFFQCRHKYICIK